MTQSPNSPSYTKKDLITNKVTTTFFVTLFKSIAHILRALPTNISRIMRKLASWCSGKLNIPPLLPILFGMTLFYCSSPSYVSEDTLSGSDVVIQCYDK